jgi:hypothetical protein
MDPAATAARRDLVVKFVQSLMDEMDSRQLRGTTTHDDVLDRPILRALNDEIAKHPGGVSDAASVEEKLYDQFDIS